MNYEHKEVEIKEAEEMQKEGEEGEEGNYIYQEGDEGGEGEGGDDEEMMQKNYDYQEGGGEYEQISVENDVSYEPDDKINISSKTILMLGKYLKK